LGSFIFFGLTSQISNLRSKFISSNMKESALLQSLEASASSVGGNDVHATLLDCTGKEELSLCYSELWRKAGAVAHCLRIKNGINAGDCLLLIVECCLDFRVILIGCLRAGVIAVPCKVGSKSHLLKVINSTGAKGILCDGKSSHIIQSALYGNHLIFIDITEVDWKCAFSQKDVIRNDQPAVIQYTDGYTGEPKHVILTHENIFHNLSLAFSCVTRSIRHRVHSSEAPDRQVVYASYLSPHSGFPLVVDCLMAFASHFHCILLPPSTFNDSPELYVEVLSAFKVNVCSATYLGLELMARRVSCLLEASEPNFPSAPTPIVEESDSGLLHIITAVEPPPPLPLVGFAIDLTSLMFVLCTGEMCRPETIARFAECFDPFGLRLDWHVQAYCVAEHTALVSYEDSLGFVMDKKRHSAAPGAMRRGFVLDRSAVDVRVVSSMDVMDDEYMPYSHHMAPDPRKRAVSDMLRDALPGEVGVIWVGSDSSAECVLGPPSVLASTGVVGTNRRKYVCTGDRGYIESGCLYLCGRESDVICIDNVQFSGSVSECNYSRLLLAAISCRTMTCLCVHRCALNTFE
jgi:acyl-CoA synthetase (AMP-forming)/AMP-acid ligase II